MSEKKKILIIEDDKTLNKVLTDELREKGYAIINAFDGDEGLQKAIDEKPDLVLLDILLPKRHGLEVLVELKKNPETASIPVIVDTVSISNSRENEVLDAGAALFLVKAKDTVEQILKIVNDFFAGSLQITNIKK